MDLLSAFYEINWLSVLVAALSAFAIGSLWYSPVLFGNSWQKLIGLSNEDIRDANMVLIFGLSFVLNLIGAIFLDMFIGPDASWVTGLISGLIVGLVWIAGAIGINYMYGRKPFKLYLIDAGYFVVFFSIMGIILGAW